MAKFNEATLFGYASTCESLQDVIKLLRDVIGEDAQSATAAYGMLLIANLTKPGPYRDDALELLNQLAHAKTELDIAAAHQLSVVEVTSKILLVAQKFTDEMTIPATEWASVDEIIAVVSQESKKFANVAAWKIMKYDENGIVIGTVIVTKNDN